MTPTVNSQSSGQMQVTEELLVKLVREELHLRLPLSWYVHQMEKLVILDGSYVLDDSSSKWWWSRASI